MPGRMKVKYRISEDEYIEAARLRAWRNLIARPSTTVLIAGAIIVILLGLAVCSVRRSRPSWQSGLQLYSHTFCSSFRQLFLAGAPGDTRRCGSQGRSSCWMTGSGSDLYIK
jgi:hypothetical protein